MWLIIIYGLVIRDNTQLGWQNFWYAVCLRVKDLEHSSTCVNGITDTLSSLPNVYALSNISSNPDERELDIISQRPFVNPEHHF